MIKKWHQFIYRKNCYNIIICNLPNTILAFIYRRLLPVFCGRYLGSVVPGVRRACLSLVRKMVHYCPAPLLLNISEPQVAASLTQLVASVLDNEVNINLFLVGITIYD